MCGPQAKAGNGGVTCLASGPRPGLVSGSREGVITSWAVDGGTVLQSIDVSQVHPASKQAPAPKGAPFKISLNPPRLNRLLWTRTFLLKIGIYLDRMSLRPVSVSLARAHTITVDAWQPVAFTVPLEKV